jgi:D-alanyl-lipoteichoic acid acyltransferase DltB (MBOAT superfamily)
VLPLGISFITFQKIAFLVDVHARRIESYTPREYMLFVLFFPQLIAGPIVHFREMMPQFRAHRGRPDGEALAVGVTLIIFGLLKKTVFADGIAAYVTPVYEEAARGGSISLFPAWLAALGFTLQIYFDFSGYSDMAAGLARCFGVRLPLNFWSPLQATSIIDFWSRWHVTLTRFLTAYLYNPLTLTLTRRRLAKGLPGLGGKHASVGAFVKLLALPTLLTMFVSGVWHGAGYTFVLWGVLHGIYLVINHAWRLTGAKLWRDRRSYERVMGPFGFLLTFLAVVAGMVLFRAPSVQAAVAVFKGMLGGNGIELPAQLVHRLGLDGRVVARSDWLTRTFIDSQLWTIGLLAIALGMPNALQIMRRYEPVLGVKERPAVHGLLPTGLAWSPSLRWALAISVVAAVAILDMGGPTEFLYWQF